MRGSRRTIRWGAFTALLSLAAVAVAGIACGTDSGGGPDGSAPVVDAGVVDAPSPADTGTSFEGVEELTVEAFHAALARGATTGADVARAYLARIQSFDAPLGAILTVNPNVVAEAEALDARFRTEGLTGPLHGVLLLVKDSIDVKGLPTSGGTTILKTSMPANDAFIIAKLRAQGAIVLAKTNLDELQIGAFGLSSRGQTRSPFGTNRVSGGSSAGTGAGISANFALLGIGADTAGSIRTPSSFCGIAGLRPTPGLVSRRGSMPGTPVKDVLGPMTRTVADLARTLDAIAGVDPGDALTQRGAAQAAVRPYAQYLDRNGLVGARLGYIRALVQPKGDTAFPQDARDANDVMLQAIQDLRAAGAEVVPVEIPQDLIDAVDAVEVASSTIGDVAGPWSVYLSGASGTNLKSFSDIAARRDELFVNFPPVLGLNGRGAVGSKADAVFDPAAATKHETLQLALQARMATFLAQAADGGAPLMALLSSYGKPPTIASGTPLGYEVPQALVPPEFGPDAIVVNLSSGGLPTLVVPAGFTPDGLPIGLHFIGRAFSEPDLLKLGFAYEQATHRRRAPKLP